MFLLQKRGGRAHTFATKKFRFFVSFIEPCDHVWAREEADIVWIPSIPICSWFVFKHYNETYFIYCYKGFLKLCFKVVYNKLSYTIFLLYVPSFWVSLTLNVCFSSHVFPENMRLEKRNRWMACINELHGEDVMWPFTMIFILFIFLIVKWEKIEWHATLLFKGILMDSMTSNSRKNHCPHGEWEFACCLEHSLRDKLVRNFRSKQFFIVSRTSLTVRSDCYNQWLLQWFLEWVDCILCAAKCNTKPFCNAPLQFMHKLDYIDVNGQLDQGN